MKSRLSCDTVSRPCHDPDLGSPRSKRRLTVKRVAWSGDQATARRELHCQD